MGANKRQMDMSELKEQLAIAILIKSGCAKKCDYCEEVTVLDDNPTSAYKLGNSLYTRGDVNVRYMFFSRRDMTDSMKEALINLPEMCHCDIKKQKEKNREERNKEYFN